jgi:predicted solute-binding protein
LRRDRDTTPLRRVLRGAKCFGLDTLDSIIANHAEFTYELRKDYLGWHIHYHLGADERRGIAKFIELLCKHHVGDARPPRFVA